MLKGEWNGRFVADMANFPASDADHFVDSFVHGMKCFVSDGSDFRKQQWVFDSAVDPLRAQLALVENFVAENDWNSRFEDLGF